MDIKENQSTFVSISSWLDDIRKRNLYFTVFLLSFITMLFHFTTVFFFTLSLWSVALVWVFLWLWNLFSFLLDVPIWILQYYMKSKTLLMLWVFAQIIAMLIFGNFIFEATGFIAELWPNDNWIIWKTLNFFLTDALNLILMLFASICYWFSKEINDITTISYVMNNASPNQYKEIIAKNNLLAGVWSLFWLVISWLILSFKPEFVVIYILFIIIAIFVLAYKFFDNKDKTINLKDVSKFKVYLNKDWLWKVKENAFNVVSNIELKNVLAGTKYIFLKPMELRKNMISPSELAQKTKESFIDIYETLKYAKSSSLIIYWSFSMVLIFGFWDTFASTFLIDFLNDLKPWFSYILLWLIAIPAFWLQWFFSKLADKIWIYFIANIWLLISWISLIFMWIFAPSNNVILLMILALCNSIWYAISMSLSVAVFLESYNKISAEKKKSKEIDSNASAAPMKILQNMANVFWLLFWSIILWIFDYAGFFIVFGFVIIWFLAWSLKNKEKVK